MIRIILLIISAFLITVTSLACSCAYSEEFNLVDYDSFKHIFEVKIESKYSFEKDTVMSDIPKLPSLYEFGLMNGYNISMIEVFKGDLSLTEKAMGFPSGSSCSWTPEIGSTYIFYANHLDDVEMCNRIIIKKYDKEKYLEEKSILQSLKMKPSEVKIKLDNNILIEGAHFSGKRDGVWYIYSTNENNDLMFKLKYEKGELLVIEKSSGYSRENEWHSISYSYFFEQINKKNENRTKPKL